MEAGRAAVQALASLVFSPVDAASLPAGSPIFPVDAMHSSTGSTRPITSAVGRPIHSKAAAVSVCLCHNVALQDGIS